MLKLNKKIKKKKYEFLSFTLKSWPKRRTYKEKEFICNSE